MEKDMEEILVDNYFIEWLRNNYMISSSNQFLSQITGTYEIMNTSLKNNSKYRHVQSIKNLPNIINNWGDHHSEEDPRNPFIKRLLYTNSIDKEVKTTFSLNNYGVIHDISLLEFSFCTEDDTCFSDISEKMKEINNEELIKLIKLYSVKHDGNGKIKLNLKSSTTQKAEGYKVYSIITLDKNNMVDFSVPFSLINLKQMLKPFNNSLMNKHLKRLKQHKANCLKYYMNVIFSPNDSKFNNKFIYPLNFYKFEI
ncbi:hypothetical protein U3516DRAFT_673994 [Neocallimastix sp. 'constans']